MLQLATWAAIWSLRVGPLAIVAAAAETAAEWGMIWTAVDDDSLRAEAGQLAANLAKGPTLALARTKQLVQQAASNTLDRQLELERDTQRELGLHDNYAEGVAAFLEKRQAVFSGDR